MRRPLRRSKLPANQLISCGFLVVAINIAQQTAQLVENHIVDTTVVFEAVAHTLPKLIEVPTRVRHTNDRHVEVSAFNHCL